MKKIFITYADAKYASTLPRIKMQAKALGLFDKVICYSDKDLIGGEVADFVLVMYPKRAGYWIWKPYLILKTLQKYPDAVVVYTDAGCTLNANMQEWSRWFELMQDY